MTADEQVKIRQLENWVLLSTNVKTNVEQAMSRFKEMASSSVSHSSTPFTDTYRIYSHLVCIYI